MEKLYYTFDETYQILGICHMTLRRLIRDGKITYARIAPGKYSFTQKMINDYIESVTFNKPKKEYNIPTLKPTS